MEEKSVALIDNLLDVQCVTPVEIIPNHVLRRPSDEERERFRTALREWGGPLDRTLFYESVIVGDEKTSTSRRTANEDEWRYWVIGVRKEHSGANNSGLLELEEASRLTDIELRFTFQLMEQFGMTVSSFGRHAVPVFFDGPRIPRTVTDDAVKRISDTYLKMQRVALSHPEIYRAIQMYERIGAADPTPHLYVLGVFGVLECLLTHDPMGKSDSLGHQIKTKMKLLDARFDTPLDCGAFGQCNFITLWSKLYDLRSLIAHGKQPTFDGALRALGSLETATRFLDQAVKKLLSHALDEPQLVADLQNC
jgi:hypothetical protein